MLLVIWAAICAAFLGVSGAYFLYTKTMAGRPWNVKISPDYQPRVAILIPVHNEEKVIQLKLRNLAKILYPKDKLEIVIANDASTDRTLEEIKAFQAQNKTFKIRVFDSQEHLGKTSCLNRVLKVIEADLIVMSDADCFWPPDILVKALPFLSDPNVGAVCARELLLNPRGSWVTNGEQFFDSTVESIRIGESKIYSTIIFHGGFAVFKRSVLDKFDEDVDDSGTALSVLQKDCRTLLLPETGFFTPFPTLWKNKLVIKLRRANQLQHLWAKVLRLMVLGKLQIPKRIALPEIFLHIFNPLLFIALVATTFLGLLAYPVFFSAVLLLLCSSLLVRKTRTVVLEVIQNNLILFASLPSFITKKGFRIWTTVQESRSLINEVALKERNLV